MIHLSRRSFAAVFVFGALAASGAASAYEFLDPDGPTWPSVPHIIVDNRGLTGVTDSDGGITRTVAAITSVNAWNGAGSGTIVTASSGSVAGFSYTDDVPMLNFQDPDGICGTSCLAAALVSIVDGAIVDADIVTNTSFAWASLGEQCSNEFYVEAVMVHEVGHALGMGHSAVSGASMWPSTPPCSYLFASTEPDDEAGIFALYGPPNSCDGNCDGMAPGGCWCDSACAVYGDCCADKVAECGFDPNSCFDSASCDAQAPGGCWCDIDCSSYGDCCDDGPC